MLTAPCRVCGTYIQRESLDDMLCGPACKALHETRQTHTTPGDPYYHAVTPEGRVAHRKAIQRKQWA